MTRLPTGTVTFLFSDVEGSTRRLEQDQAEAGRALARHHEIFQAIVAGHHGVIFETVGDAVYAAFEKASNAAAAAVGAHRALAANDWGGFEPLLVRVAINTGEVEARGRHYFGPALFRCARLQVLGWGGQTLVSAATARLLRGALGSGLALHDRGLHSLKDLADPEQVFELVDDESARAFPALRSADAHPNNLPDQLSTFVGREADLDALVALVRTHPLVTITGIGGTGKTRLSLEAAARLLDETTDGVWFVDLAPVRHAEEVVIAVAAVLGVREQPPVPLIEAVTARIQSQRLLLILDNLEQVVDAAHVVGQLLGAPEVRVIATSREPLRLRGEREFPHSPLAVPRVRHDTPADEIERSPSVRLFVDRAREVLPSFELSPSSAPIVAAICARLDGLPLAIELAAVLVRLLSPQQMLDRLDARLDMAARNRDLPERQRTLRAALAWSHDLLHHEEARAFAGLAVFVDGFTLAAAEAVLDDLGPDVLGLVGALLDKSLLVRTFDQQGEARFRMLETVREFASERLGESPDFERRKTALGVWARTVVTREGRGLRWTDALPDASSFDAEAGNIVEAIRWLEESGRTDDFVEVVSATSSFWMAAGRLTEARPWLSRAIELGGTTATPWRARLLRNAASVEQRLVATDRAFDLIERSIEDWRAVGDGGELSEAMLVRGGFLLDRGEPATAREAFTEAEALARAAGDEMVQRACLSHFGGLAAAAGELEVAKRFFEALREASSRAGDPFALGLALGNLSYLHFIRGDVVRAESDAREAVRLFTELGQPEYLGSSLQNLAGVMAKTGRLDEATPLAIRALRLTWEAGVVKDVSACLDTLADIALRRGDAELVIRLMTTSRRIREKAGLSINSLEREALVERLESARGALGEAFDRIQASAEVEPVEDVVREQLSAASGPGS